MFSHFHCGQGDRRPSAAGSGGPVCESRLIRRGSVTKVAAVSTDTKRGAMCLIRRHQPDSRVGRPEYRWPTGRRRVGWEGAVH
jgi:hypothetical protein